MSENDILNIDTTSYNEIPQEEVYIDPTSNQVYSQEDLLITPFDVIKATAEKLGQTIKDPDPNCKHCYGRGYVGRDSDNKAPIPCGCIYSIDAKKSAEDIYRKTRKMTRAERREQERKYRKMIKKGGLH